MRDIRFFCRQARSQNVVLVGSKKNVEPCFLALLLDSVSLRVHCTLSIYLFLSLNVFPYYEKTYLGGNIEKNIEIISIFINKLVVSFLCHLMSYGAHCTMAFIFFLKKYVPTLCKDLFTMKKAKR